MAPVAVDLVNLIESETSMPATGPTVVDYSTFIHYWLEILSRVTATSLVYQVKSPQVRLCRGTFAPTSLNLQEYEYKDPAKTDTSNNCLVYAQMVEINGVADPLPTSPYYFYTGNIVDASKHGTMMISQKAFWTNWLLPLMQEVNYLTWINQAYVHNSGIEGSEDWTWGCKIGLGAANERCMPTQCTHGHKEPQQQLQIQLLTRLFSGLGMVGSLGTNANHGSLVQSYLSVNFLA